MPAVFTLFTLDMLLNNKTKLLYTDSTDTTEQHGFLFVF